MLFQSLFSVTNAICLKTLFCFGIIICSLLCLNKLFVTKYLSTIHSHFLFLKFWYLNNQSVITLYAELSINNIGKYKK